MSSSSSPATIAAAEDSGISVLHPDIIQTQILNRVEASTLAAASCASTELSSLCKNDDLWRGICNSNWPSTADPRLTTVIADFPAGYRSFYSDAFPVVSTRRSGEIPLIPEITTAAEIISAVDIYFEEKCIYSKVFETKTVSYWFLNTPFILELLEMNETATVTLPSITFPGWEDRLRLSWIVIDTNKRRAMNVASEKVLEVCRLPLGEDTEMDTQLRFPTVVMTSGGRDMVQCTVTVACGGEEGQGIFLRQVSLQIQDMEDKTLTGNESLWVLSEAMDEQRRKSAGGSEQKEYEMFIRMKEIKKNRRLRKEKRMEIAIIAIEIALLIVIWKSLLCK